MVTSPYRVPTEERAPQAPAAASPHLDLVTVGGLAWVVTIVRVVAALARAEAPNRELDLAWLFLFLGPLLIWHELGIRRNRPTR